MSVYSWNASMFTSRPESHIDQERHNGVRKAAALIREGKPGRALYELARSVERQNRIAGLGTHAIAPTCPCGRVCAHQPSPSGDLA